MLKHVRDDVLHCGPACRRYVEYAPPEWPSTGTVARPMLPWKNPQYPSEWYWLPVRRWWPICSSGRGPRLSSYPPPHHTAHHYTRPRWCARPRRTPSSPRGGPCVRTNPEASSAGTILFRKRRTVAVEWRSPHRRGFCGRCRDSPDP